MERISVTPSTVREGLTYHDGVRLMLTLTAPANRNVSFRITSSDTGKVVSGPLSFQKGEQEKTAHLDIKWKSVDRDCQVGLKVSDPEHPETILRSRIYLRKAQAAKDEKSP